MGGRKVPSCPLQREVSVSYSSQADDCKRFLADSHPLFCTFLRQRIFALKKLNV